MIWVEASLEQNQRLGLSSTRTKLNSRGKLLMARHFESAGAGEEWKRNVVLKQKLWSGQQHTPLNNAHHARFMRPGCHLFDLCESAISLPLKPLVLF